MPYFFCFLPAPFWIFLLRQFFMQIPQELSDAARLDGANELRILFQIIMPQSWPALVAVSLFGALHAWNDFLGPLLYLQDPDKYTLSVGLDLLQLAGIARHPVQPADGGLDPRHPARGRALPLVPAHLRRRRHVGRLQVGAIASALIAVNVRDRTYDRVRSSVAASLQRARKDHLVHAVHLLSADVDTLQELNRDYVRSVQESDVRRFEELLADDFVCIQSDGSLLDRAAFLEHTAHPAAISDLEAHDVRIRFVGPVALIHARTTFTRPDGQPGGSRYTDVWRRHRGGWRCIAAQVTRS